MNPVAQLAEAWERMEAELRELRQRVEELEENANYSPQTSSRSPRRLWLDVAQAADHCGRHPVTIRRALQAGALHGHQARTHGRWRIHVDCLDSWCGGKACRH